MVLVFEVNSSLAMYRKGYTTTSLVSYPFCPPTAVAGLLASITGIDNGANDGADRAEYWNKLKGTQIGINILSPIAWYSTAVNFIQFKSPSGSMGNHTRARHQFLKKPRYRIYVKGGELYEELKTRLTRGECIFTPYLGVSCALADVDYQGELSEEEAGEHLLPVKTVVPHAKDMEIDIKKTGVIYKEVIPFAQDTYRSFRGSVTVYYGGHRGNGTVYLKKKGDSEIGRVGGDIVAWFAPW